MIVYAPLHESGHTSPSSFSVLSYHDDLSQLLVSPNLTLLPSIQLRELKQKLG